MDINSIRTKYNFHKYITLKQKDNTSDIELVLCNSNGQKFTELNSNCTITLLDIVDRVVRARILNVPIRNGEVSFKVTQHLKSNRHNLEITLDDGRKFPSDGDFTVNVGSTHDNVELNLVQSISKEQVIEKISNDVKASVTTVATDYLRNNAILFKGEVGPRGEIGLTGKQGIQGPQGVQGDPFTYEEFTEEQLALLKGPKGDKGDKGDKGADGKDGKSAYEIAVDNGFEGSEAEWIMSLKNEFTPKESVKTKVELPSNASKNELRLVIDENKQYVFDGTKWIEFGSVKLDGLAEFNKKIKDMEEKSYLYKKMNSVYQTYEVSDTFKSLVPFNLFINKNGEVSFNYDVAINKIKPTKTYYVDIKTGDNNNPGTEDKPLKTVSRAKTLGDADNIIVKSGIYGWSGGWNGGNISKPFNLIGIGDVYLGAYRDNLTWSQNSTYSNVYQSTGSAVLEVVDIKDFENIIAYEKRTSVQEVSSKPGSYYIEGNNIYVRTIDNRKPDEYVLPNMLNEALKITNSSQVYIENIKFTNSVKHIASGAGQKFYAKDCVFALGTANNCLSLEGVDFEIMKSIAKDSVRDGFNYHSFGSYTSNGIEIDCIGAFNGRDGADQNNGSTMHDGGKIIRIRGEYHHNHGPNVIDVNNGTQSLNIGVHAHHSTADSDLSNVDFRLRDEGGGSQMLLVNCVSHDSKYSLSIEGKATETIENSLLMSPTSRI
ncbi:hypothetical protein CW666_02110 [Macrococcoides caseolyticum]|uniref:collagen-like triple helix repeat-containing protein n=1 Tax=Macrococcoides caseolyticum TaxID=69966 RepID=UPI000C34A17F|nr:collagen-like protein [Macrococcus caseolyticus]PKE45361.1 hypothetical protein CW666_02110 [Macrococcus caseolyticus]